MPATTDSPQPTRALVRWSGAATTDVDLYATARKMAATVNDGAHTDNIVKKGRRFVTSSLRGLEHGDLLERGDGYLLAAAPVLKRGASKPCSGKEPSRRLKIVEFSGVDLGAQPKQGPRLARRPHLTASDLRFSTASPEQAAAAEGKVVAALDRLDAELDERD